MYHLKVSVNEIESDFSKFQFSASWLDKVLKDNLSNENLQNQLKNLRNSKKSVLENC